MSFDQSLFCLVFTIMDDCVVFSVLFNYYCFVGVSRCILRIYLSNMYEVCVCFLFFVKLFEEKKVRKQK